MEILKNQRLDEIDRRWLVEYALKQAKDRLAILEHIYVRLGSKTTSNPITTDNYNQLEGIRTEVEVILDVVINELVHVGTFDSLVNHCKAKLINEQEKNQAIQRETDTRDRIGRVKTDLSRFQVDSGHQMTKLDDTIVSLKIEIQKVKRDFHQSLPLLEEQSQKDIAKIKIQSNETEQIINQRLEILKRNFDEEIKSHTDVMSVFEHCQAAMEETEKSSAEHHKDEIINMDIQIKNLQNKIKEIKKVEEQMSKKVEILLEQLDGERRDLQLAEREAEDQAKLAATIKIQHWWRDLVAVAKMNMLKKKKKKPKKRKK